MVKITETPDGLELRSTSWYEIDAKMKELTIPEIIGYLGNGEKGIRNSVKSVYNKPEYEFIEDHAELFHLSGMYFKTGRMECEIWYVISLRRIIPTPLKSND